jgi:hypothetical protein
MCMEREIYQSAEGLILRESWGFDSCCEDEGCQN